MLPKAAAGQRRGCSKIGLELSLGNSTTALPAGFPAAGRAARLEGNLVL